MKVTAEDPYLFLEELDLETLSREVDAIYASFTEEEDHPEDLSGTAEEDLPETPESVSGFSEEEEEEIESEDLSGVLISMFGNEGPVSEYSRNAMKYSEEAICTWPWRGQQLYFRA